MRLLKIIFNSIIIFSFQGFAYSPLQIGQNHSGSDRTIKIGLLIPENKSLAAKNGAELAIRRANENGGFNGKPFKLVVMSMEGPWGTGSKKAVDLIFEEKVCAIMGSHDGRNAHLVEQVTTKARIVFLSSWAGDPTLSQAFVPWYFSCVPNNLQQADALIEEIYNKRKLIKIAAVSDTGYDSKQAMKSFLKRTKIAGKTDPLQFYYDSDQDNKALFDLINKADVNGIVLFGKPSGSVKLMQQLRQRKMNQSVFGALSLLDEDAVSDNDFKYYENIVLVSSEILPGPRNAAFREEYERAYGKLPGAVATYSFDGMSLLIEAIRTTGLNRIDIQKALIKIHFEGVTGLIRFDDKGNRIGIPGVMEIKNGTPVAPGR